jgi:hypothetical protein
MFSTKLCWNDPWVVPFQNCVRHFRPPTKMAATVELNLTSTVWLQLAKWFVRRRLLCEFPIGSYVKLSSAVGAILVEGPNHRTHFWKRTIQWLFHQHLVLKGGMKFPKNLLWNYWANLNQTLLKWSLGGPLPKLCPTFQTSDQDGRHSRT